MSKLDKFGEWKNPGKVFITGASSGIGASYAKAFAENGFDLVLLARRKDRLQALANLLESDCSIHCEIITADLSEKEDIKKAANHIRQIDEDILDPIGKRTYAKPSMPAYYRSDLGVSLAAN